MLEVKLCGGGPPTAVAFEPLDLMSKLAALIPRPRANTLRFHGVYAPNSHFRSDVVPDLPNSQSAGACGHHQDPDEPEHRYHRLLWADLLARVHVVDVFRCPRCSSKMQRIAWITDADTIHKILNAVGMSADSPTGRSRSTDMETSHEEPVN